MNTINSLFSKRQIRRILYGNPAPRYQSTCLKCVSAVPLSPTMMMTVRVMISVKHCMAMCHRVYADLFGRVGWSLACPAWKDLSYNLEPSPQSLLPKDRNGLHSGIQPKTLGSPYNFRYRTECQSHDMSAHRTSTARFLQPQPRGFLAKCQSNSMKLPRSAMQLKDSQPPDSPHSELRFTGGQAPIPVSFMPKHRCQFEDLLCVSVAAAAGDASGGLFMVKLKGFKLPTSLTYDDYFNNHFPKRKTSFQLIQSSDFLSDRQGHYEG
ncbi:hypothetical protein D9C73_011723 [Collichthys lucidus]|uniref:Uncharacterized protein n=1 Tax=Collichthys lucidus TaxID=240159 RepID=A0A4V6APQ9_COLLU|nr:hypothetical protein D9C73_011723 [Collichthys lucidus]